MNDQTENCLGVTYSNHFQYPALVYAYMYIVFNVYSFVCLLSMHQLR